MERIGVTVTDCQHHWPCQQSGFSRCRKCGEERLMLNYLDGAINPKAWVSREKDPAAFMRGRRHG